MTDTPRLISADVSADDLRRCIQIFEAISEDFGILKKLSEDERIQFLTTAGQATKPDPALRRRRHKLQRKQEREAQREANKAVRERTTIRKVRQESFFVAPDRLLEAPTEASATKELETPDICYVCKDDFTRVHHFYDSLCPTCADFNYSKRFQTAPLHGQVALITGARLKIGYQAALMMLRAGAQVIVTTRFPKDAALRYAEEKDFSDWQDRLQVYGLDLRHAPSVEAFTQYLCQTLSHLDILINNAAQTVRRPPGFYAHIMPVENTPTTDLAPHVQTLLAPYEECRRVLQHGRFGAEASDGTHWVSEWHNGAIRSGSVNLSQNAPTRTIGAPAQALGILASAELSQIPYACDGAAELHEDLFPEGRLDQDLQQVDLRAKNSWRMALAEVPTPELIEVQLVNSISPFILCSKLKPLMLKNKTGQRHIVNVSAMEGKFSRHTKTDKHPHTNMAKAALNMMTLTSARDYQRDGIFMNAVDTGWVTDEDPAQLSARKQVEHDFQPPLDIVDGAARVMDPVFAGTITGKPVWGNFLKDYVPTEW